MRPIKTEEASCRRKNVEDREPHVMLSFISILLVAGLRACAADDLVYYDSYNGSQLTTDQVALREAEDTTFYCVNAFAACNSSEGRRIDGSCTSLTYPTSGAGHAPFLRFLAANFTDGTEPRLAANGSALPPPRWLRTRALAEGRVAGHKFSQLMTLFFVFAATDVAAMSIHDTLNYVSNHPNCCNAAGASDSVCYPMSVPWDDPVHRFSGVRCLNMTRPISFQSSGCVDNTTTPVSRMNYGTPFFDLSNMYGNANDTSTRQRLFTGGLLNYTLTSTGKQWPQYIAPSVNRYDGIQGLTGVNYFFGLWFWREHNRVAAELASLNPCWDDEKLFTVARDINIASYQEITYYELFSTMMGEENLVADGVLGCNSSFRDPYDETAEPGEYLEALLALRWVHTIQEGMLQLYLANGTHMGEFPEVNFTLSTAALAQANNFMMYSQGAIRSSCGKIDNIIDPIVGELGLGPSQRVVDLTSSDVMKGRLFGAQPYISYLNYCNCSNETFDTWDSLSDYIDEHKRILLSELYNTPSDVDLVVGLWLEELVEGGHVPRTFYCLVVKQLLVTVTSDRHWYERETRPNAFTEDQLLSIRNASAARLLCDNGDDFTYIQPNAFEIISDSNPLTLCTSLPAVDLTLWQDSTCSA